MAKEKIGKEVAIFLKQAGSQESTSASSTRHNAETDRRRTGWAWRLGNILGGGESFIYGSKARRQTRADCELKGFGNWAD